MNYNELSKKAYANSVKHGFRDNKPSNEHSLMLIVTEVAEMVEADRKNKRADRKSFETLRDMVFRRGDFKKTDELHDQPFKVHIKDTLEDEMADVAIRLFDLAGALGIDFEKLSPCRYYRAFDRFTFTENALGLVKGLCRDNIGIEKRVLFGLFYVEQWAKHLKVDLDWHVEHKMKYNEHRPALHNKKY